MSPDPLYIAAYRLANPQPLNLYSYIRNNPVNLIDPTGMIEDLACQAVNQDQCSRTLDSKKAAPQAKQIEYTNAFDPCTPGSLNAGAQPNLAASKDEGPQGSHYHGVTIFDALSCATNNDPADPACWGVKFTFSPSSGTFKGSWSLDAYATDKEKEFNIYAQATLFNVPLPEKRVGTLLVNDDPLDPSQLIPLTSYKPNPIPDPTARSYVCTAMYRTIVQLQGTPQLAPALAVYQKSCR